MPLKILHTADVHLGAKFLGLGEKGALHREQLLETFENVVSLGLQEGVSIFIIAGDLFDSSRVSRTLLDQVARQIERLTGEGVKVCITPGTHDPYGPASPYALPPMSDIQGLVVFTEEELTAVTFPEMDCTLYGNANMTPFENKYPLADFTTAGDSRWHVGILHANFEVPDVFEDTYEITDEQIASSGLDYIALGHLHSLSDRSCGGVKAYYPGSPELIRMQKGLPGNVLLVELDEGVTVTPVKVGTREFEEVTVQAEQIISGASLFSMLEEYADPWRIIRLNVEGLQPPGYPDILSLVEEISDEFFLIDIHDGSSPAPDTIDPDRYPPGSPTRAYLLNLGSRLEHADQSEKEELLEAMRVGVSLLGEEGEQ